ncbi:MAG: CPBP family glutamic-type intramembrane protease [Thermodesulfobacteriota bacterium]
MNYIKKKPEYKLPILSYLLLITSIYILRLFLGWDTAFIIGAVLMLVIPFLIRRDLNFFYYDSSGFIKGLGISIIILIIYIVVLFMYSRLNAGHLSIREFGISFLLIQFFLVAIPEEVFFRGYLQKCLGNDYKAIIIVSILFAIAHLIIVCAITGGINVCAQNALTFFPSLIMGYLFMKTTTIWSSVVFHFLANVVHILIYIR